MRTVESLTHYLKTPNRQTDSSNVSNLIYETVTQKHAAKH